VDPKQYHENNVGGTENKENSGTVDEGGAKCASFENKSVQIAQLLQALEALTPEARNALLHALDQGGAVEYLQGENVDRRGKPPLREHQPEPKQNKGKK
jgi:hypothetical protein